MNDRIMQNPGDVRLLKDQVLIPFKKVLVIDGARLVNPGDFDEIGMLPGVSRSDEEERAALEATTVSQ